MVELSKQGYFSRRDRRDSFRRSIELHLLQCNHLVSFSVSSLVDLAVCALANHFEVLVLVISTASHRPLRLEKRKKGGGGGGGGGEGGRAMEKTTPLPPTSPPFSLSIEQSRAAAAAAAAAALLPAPSTLDGDPRLY